MLHHQMPLAQLMSLSDTGSDLDLVLPPPYSPVSSNSSEHESAATEIVWEGGEEVEASQERQESEESWWNDGSLCELLVSLGFRDHYWWFADHALLCRGHSLSQMRGGGHVERGRAPLHSRLQCDARRALLV